MKEIFKFWILASVLTLKSLAFGQISTTMADLGACNGSATVTNISNYTNYFWTDSIGQTLATNTDSLSNLCIGSYCFIGVNSTNSTFDTLPFTITNLCSSLNLTTTIINESAIDSCDGSITLVATGGSAPYSYSIDAGVTGNSSNVFSNLCGGIYTVLVTDVNGCLRTFAQTVNFLNDSTACNLAANAIIVSNDTLVACDVNVLLNVSGATGPIICNWNGVTSSQNINFPYLCNNIYYWSITDSIGCTVNAFIDISTDTNNTITPNPCESFGGYLTTTNASATGVCDGSIAVNYYGNTGTVTYFWSDGSNAGINNNVCPNYNYSVIVTDSTGCTIQLSAGITDTISTVNNLQESHYVYDASVAGACDGSISIYAYGGVDPYSYQHSTGAQTSYNSGLCPGMYSVTITDATGNSIVVPYMVALDTNVFDSTSYPNLAILDTLVNFAENCEIDYSSLDSAFVAGYDFFGADSVVVYWEVYDSISMTSFTETYYLGGGQGVYNLELDLFCSTKSTGKFMKIKGQILKSGNVNLTEIVQENGLLVYPNPFTNLIKVAFDAPDNFNVSLFDISGRMITQESFINATTFEMSNLSSLSKGEYILKIQTSNEIFTRKIIK